MGIRERCYEGKLKVYRPQFFKENLAMVMNVSNCLKDESIEQYKMEERALIAKRLINTQKRYKQLIKCMRARRALRQTCRCRRPNMHISRYATRNRYKNTQ